MLIYLVKKLKFQHLILHWKIVFGIFLVLSACSDLVKESDTGACDSAIDARNYDKALSVCTSRKDKASAYMGKAGYDIINLLKSSGSSEKAHTAPSGVSLGTDDSAPASILHILQLSKAIIPDNNTRAAAISSSKTNLHSAYELLQPYLNDNSSPLTTDEILLNTFAISFAMQLNQLEIFDNKTTSTSTLPSVNNLSCTQVSDYASTKARVVLIAMDGHLWAAERNGMMCTRIKNAVEALDNDTAEAAVVTAKYLTGVKLHDDIFAAVCGPLDALTEDLSELALNLTELKKAISLSGDNTKVIEKADNSTKALMAAVGCVK